MFAYCLNNPVNGCDPCGTCFHQLKFWNDCAKCGGRTWDEKLNDLATGIYGYATDVYDAHMMQNEWQQQIDQMSINAMRDSSAAVLDALARSNELQSQRQYETDMAVLQTAEFVTNDPLAIVDWTAGAVGLGTTYVGYAAACAGVSISAGGAIALGAIGMACGLWGMGRLIAAAMES